MTNVMNGCIAALQQNGAVSDLVKNDKLLATLEVLSQPGDLNDAAPVQCTSLAAALIQRVVFAVQSKATTLFADHVVCLQQAQRHEFDPISESIAVAADLAQQLDSDLSLFVDNYLPIPAVNQTTFEGC